MGLGIIGLGQAGTDMVRRLIKVGHQCVVYDTRSVSVHALASDDPVGAISIGDFVSGLSKPRAIWMMAPSAEVDAALSAVIPHLDREDVVIYGGGSCHRDDTGRFSELKAKGVHYVDAGTNAVALGTDQIGGLKLSLPHPDPVHTPRELTINSAAAHVPRRERAAGTVEHNIPKIGPSGTGGFVNTIDTGITYGLTAAYTEEMTILHNTNLGMHRRDSDTDTTLNTAPELHEYDLNLADIAESWRRGSVISSWLVDLAAKALLDSPGLDKFAVRVSDSDEGRWTVVVACDKSIQAPVLTAAMYERFGPHGEAGFADKVLSALCIKCGSD